MNYTKRDKEIYRRVDLIKNPIAECKKRWPDFAFEVRVTATAEGKLVKEVTARWTRDGIARGFKEQIRHDAGSEDVAWSKENIARGALMKAEYDA